MLAGIKYTVMRFFGAGVAKIMAGFYFGLAILSVLATFSAVMQARRLYWFVPVYFLSAWLTGELALIHLVLQNPTSYTTKLELEKDKQNHILIPFSAVIAIGDFMVVAEEDII